VKSGLWNSYPPRDVATGALTQLPEPQGCVSQSGSGGHCTQGKALDGASAVVTSKDGRFVYVASEKSRAVAVFARDRSSGALQQLPGEDGCAADDPSLEQCSLAVGLGAPGAMALSPDVVSHDHDPGILTSMTQGRGRAGS